MYVKFSNRKGGEILSFRDQYEGNIISILQMLSLDNPDFKDYQEMKDGEEKQHFNNVFYVHYSYNGTPLKGVYLYFDFENEQVIISYKKYKIKNDFEFTWKLQKTQIRANDGVEGFYRYIIRCMDQNRTAFHTDTFRMLERAAGA